MDRLSKFEHNRFVGDKRTQTVYDVGAIEEDHEHILEELVSAETYLCFGPDTLAEARNRGYKLARFQSVATEG